MTGQSMYLVGCSASNFAGSASCCHMDQRGVFWRARRGKRRSREQDTPGLPSMDIFGTLGDVVRLFLMMGGAGDSGPRKLDRQPCHAACPHGEEAEESITDGGKGSRNGSVKKV